MRAFLKQLLDPILRAWAKWSQKRIDRKYAMDGRRNNRRLRYVLAECGDHLTVHGNPIVCSPEKVHVGSHVTLNGGAQICPRGEVYIGDYVTMSRGSQIISGTLDMDHWVQEGYKDHLHTQGDVYIGEGTWLCVNSIVLPGVKITGKGVVVAAGAVVTKDITEDYVVVGGVPARIVKRMTEGQKEEKSQ